MAEIKTPSSRNRVSSERLHYLEHAAADVDVAKFASMKKLGTHVVQLGDESVIRHDVMLRGDAYAPGDASRLYRKARELAQDDVDRAAEL